jgi:hypothetical protein
MESTMSRTSQHLARQAIETSLAAPVVVAHRLSRMAASGSPLSARDRREFTTMGTEKVLAFWQSWVAMCMQAAASQMAFAQSAAISAWRIPFGSRAKILPSSSALRHATHALMSAGLAPVHRTAVGNARRLSRRRG